MALGYDELGTGLDWGYFSVDRELIDTSTPSVTDFLDMIEQDSQAQLILFALTLPILASNVTIEEGPEDKGEAEFIREVMLRGQHQGGMKIPIHDVVAQMCEAQATKRVYFEQVWRLREDGKQVIDKLAWRPPRQCTVLVDEKGYPDGFRQLGMDVDGKPLDIKFRASDGKKAFLFIHQARRRPGEGVSTFQTAYYDWQEKQKVNRLHNVYLQNFALPKVVAKYTGRARRGARKLFDKVKKWVKGTGGAIVLDQSEAEGRGEEIEVLSAAAAGSDFLDKITLLNTQMAGSAMLKWMNLGTEGNTGAWALSRDHSDFFLLGQEAVQNDIASQLTNGPIADMIKVNFGEDASYPECKFAPLSETQQRLALETWTKLVSSPNRPQGAMWTALEEIAVRFLGVDIDKIREEEPEEDEGLPGVANPQDLLKAIEDAVKGSPQDSPKPSGNGDGGPAPGEQGRGTEANVAPTRGAAQSNGSRTASLPRGGGSAR